MDRRRAKFTPFIFCFLYIFLFYSTGYSVTLADIRTRGELHHLGVPYARFANNNADGLDCALMRKFAQHLGVRYTFIPTTWGNAIPDLTGRHLASLKAEQSSTPPRGDVLASGISIIPERQQRALFSKPTFTTQVWLITKPEVDITPIQPSGNIEKDIAMTVAKTAGKTVYGLKDVCLDVRRFPALLSTASSAGNASLQEIPEPLSFLKSNYPIFLMESPSALMALEMWPYSFKIIGPIANQQSMGAAFAPESVELRDEFNRFFTALWESGEYRKLVHRYYPSSYLYFNKFFTMSSP